MFLLRDYAAGNQPFPAGAGLSPFQVAQGRLAGPPGIGHSRAVVLLSSRLCLEKTIGPANGRRHSIPSPIYVSVPVTKFTPVPPLASMPV